MHMHADGRSSAAASACQPSSRSRFNQPPADRFRLPRALQSCCNAGGGRIPFPCVGRRAWCWCCCWPGRPWPGQRERRPRAAMHAWPGAVGSNVPPELGPSTTPFPFLLRRSLSQFDDGGVVDTFARKELTGDAGTSCSCVCTDPQTGWNWRPI